jgi:Lhr-like helicase
MLKEIVQVKKEGEYISYEKLSIDKYPASKSEIALSHSFVMDVLRKVMGRTLTIIDASIIDKQQNKALKDLLRQVISDEMEFSAEMAFNQEELMATIKDDDIDMSKSVTIEEALGVESR